ncbi:SRPBCC domain-containing protein [soil metagenome]
MANDATTDATAKERTLVIERTFRAPPERVFRAWTDPTVLVRWWGPKDYSAPGPEMDLRGGGKWRSVMLGPNGASHIVSGTYREIAPPRRLVMTWAWETDGQRGHETVIELTLEAAAGGTRMRLVQGVFETPKARDGHDWGWTSSFERLEAMFERT